MDVEAIHEGLANAAGSITGLRTYPSLPGAINPPVFAPTEFEMEYHQTFSASGGLTAFMFSCGIFASYAADQESGRKTLAGYLAESGATSILAAVESDKTLGGVCKTLVLRRVRGAYRLYTIGDNEYLGAIIDVAVWA